MLQKDALAAVAASLQQKGQLLEQEAHQQITVLNDRILQLSSVMNQVVSERNGLNAEIASKDFFIAEVKEKILAQGNAVTELKANSVAQDLVLEERREEITALRAERGTLKAQNASLNIRVAEIHDDMKDLRRDLMAARSDVQRADGAMAAMKAEHCDPIAKSAAADSSIGRLQNELAPTRYPWSSQTGAGQEKFNAELQHFRAKGAVA